MILRALLLIKISKRICRTGKAPTMMQHHTHQAGASSFSLYSLYTSSISRANKVARVDISPSSIHSSGEWA